MRSYELLLVAVVGGASVFGCTAPDADVATSTASEADLIVFQSERDGNWEIYTMGLDGGNQRRLTNDPSADRGPWFSADGERINFRSDRSGEFVYYSMSTDGGDIRPYQSSGSPSPDGSARVSTRDVNGFPQLVLSAPAGEEILTDNLDDPLVSVADWAPDGQALLYLAGQGYGSMKIWYLLLESKETRLLTPEDGTHNTAEFSPDGRRILFNSNRDGDMSTYVMGVDGGNVLRLLADRISAHATWASDSLIVLDTESSPGVFDVHVMKADGSGLANLSRTGKDGWPSVRRP